MKIVQLLTAFLGSLGFALVFGVRRKLVPYCALGGFLEWGLYLLLMPWMSKFIAALVSSAFAAVYAMVLAKACKAPSTIFYITTIIPMVPGGSLYYMMASIVRQDSAMAMQYGMDTLEMVLALAGGLALVSAARQILPEQH
ncbi:MAG: threonine/serine exporter family protein [Bulleidia sp.]|nr:threonine/serine exporter family protein [Bulleidia sp.]